MKNSYTKKNKKFRNKKIQKTQRIQRRKRGGVEKPTQIVKQLQNQDELKTFLSNYKENDIIVIKDKNTGEIIMNEKIGDMLLLFQESPDIANDIKYEKYNFIVIPTISIIENLKNKFNKLF
jgi:hypothetical protein